MARAPYRPIGDNPDPAHPPDPPPPRPLDHVPDDNPAHDDSAAPDD